MEEEGELLLSEAFLKKQKQPNLELRVKVKNINMGNSRELFEKCRSIREYMIFVDKVRRYSLEKSPEEAVKQAIDECLSENVMADFLQKNRAEVMKVCIYEYDEEKQRKWDREEGREEGHQEERENSIRILIGIYKNKKFHYEKEDLLKVLKENYHLTEEEAEQMIAEMDTDKLSCY